MKTYSSKPSKDERLNYISCNFCGSRLHVRHYRADGAEYSRCRGCGLVFQNPMPDERALRKRYDSDYYEYEIENEKNFFGLMKHALKDVGFELGAPDAGQGKRILDIGCATGMLLDYLKKSGQWETEGVEVCEAAVRYGRENRSLSIFHGTLEEASCESASFEVVHASHVIEHVTDPSSFLREIYRILKPGGHLIITTPNIDGLQSKIFGAGWRSAIADHMYLFSKKTLAKFLLHSGFTIEKRKTWGGLAAGAGPAWLKRILDGLAKPFGFGDVMVFLARK